MPYCSQCGNQAAPEDLHCRHCGAKQPVSAPPVRDFMAGISPRTAAILCYIPVVGWIASIIVLAADRFRGNQRVRFHAFQGLYLFVAWLIVNEVLRPLFRDISGGMRLDKVLEAVLMFTWIFMLVKASHDETYSLPIIGDLAQKSAADR